MSARLIFVLALVAVVSVQANSYPFRAKGQADFGSVKGGKAFHQDYVQQPQYQQVEAVAAAPARPVVQTASQQQAEFAPVKGGQSSYQESFKGQSFQQPQYQQVEAVATAPVRPVAQTVSQQSHQVEAAPTKGGQSFYQESFKGQSYQQPQYQQVEAVAAAPARPVVQAVNQQQWQQTYAAPVKGAQSTYQESFKGQSFQQPQYQQVEAVAAAPARPMVQAVSQQAEYAPVKGAQSTYQESFKGQSFQQPQYQQVEAVAAAPAARPVVQAVSQQSHQAEYAPVKGGQNFYQESFKGQSYQQPQYQQVEAVAAAPAARPVVQAVSQQSHQAEYAPVKGGQNFYQESFKGHSFQQPQYQQVEGTKGVSRARSGQQTFA